MTTIIAIYDDSLKLEKAIEQLTSKNFQEEVIDPNILTRQADHPAQPGPGISPVPGVAVGTPTAASPAQTDEARQEAVRLLRDRLGRLHLSDEEIKHYTNLFNHQGKFLIVKSDTERVSQAVDIMRANGASQVNKH